MRYWELSELNVFRTGEDTYQLVSADGTLVEISEDVAKVVFLIPGVRDLGRLGKDAGFYGVDLGGDEAGTFLAELERLMLLTEVPMPPVRRFNADRAIRNMSVVSQGPIALGSLTLSLTEGCPYLCTYCYRERFRGSSATLPEELVLTAIHDAAQLGARLVEFSGGEPALLASRLNDYAGVAKAMGIPYIGVVSSGWGLTKETLSQWRASGINQLNIKLDYWDSDLQDRVCGYVGAWSLAVEAIRTSVDLGMSVRVLTTYFGQELDHLGEIASFAQQVGARKHVVGVAVPLGHSQPIPPALVKQCAAYVRELGKSNPVIKIALLDYDGVFSTPMICPAGITRVAVGPTGTITGCPLLEGIHSAGNIYERSLWNVWVQGEWAFLRHSVNINEKCATCSIRAYCIGNCFAFGQALFGDPTMAHERYCARDAGGASEKGTPDDDR